MVQSSGSPQSFPLMKLLGPESFFSGQSFEYNKKQGALFLVKKKTKKTKQKTKKQKNTHIYIYMPNPLKNRTEWPLLPIHYKNQRKDKTGLKHPFPIHCDTVRTENPAG